jgi:quercetin dioxygenase-like cupin family protein
MPNRRWRREAGRRNKETMTGSAQAIKHIENDRVIVTEYRFGPGDNTGWHRHEHDYVVVPLMDGRLKLVSAKGDSYADMRRGASYFRDAGVEHDVVNATDGAYAFVEIELKQTGPRL